MKPALKWLPIEGRINLVGVKYGDYQLVCDGIKAGTVLRLFGEPYNKYDTLAVSVRYKDIHLGYIPRYTIHQSELWRYHRLGHKCIAVVINYDKTRPAWCAITVQLKRTAQSLSHIGTEYAKESLVE